MRVFTSPVVSVDAVDPFIVIVVLTFNQPFCHEVDRYLNLRESIISQRWHPVMPAIHLLCVC